MSRSVDELEPVPSELRQALKGDFASVASLAPPSRRALGLALPTIVVMASAHLLIEVLGGATPLSLSRMGVGVLQWLAGLGLLWLALREAVPGLGVGAGKALFALSGGIGLQAILGLLIWQRSGAGITGLDAASIGAQCALMEGLIAIPHLAIAIWLARKAFPIRPRWSGALAGGAAGLLADVVWHLACPRTDLRHLVLWHPGATILMTLLGAAAGWLWGRRAGARDRRITNVFSR